MDPEQVKRARTLGKTWLTKHTNIVKEALEDPGLTSVKLNRLIVEFDRLVVKLSEAQTNYELSLKEDADFDAIITEAANFLAEKYEVKDKATEKLDSLSTATATLPPVNIDGSTSHTTDQRGTFDAKLPKLTLPRFSGDVLHWL